MNLKVIVVALFVAPVLTLGIVNHSVGPTLQLFGLPILLAVFGYAFGIQDPRVALFTGLLIVLGGAASIGYYFYGSRNEGALPTPLIAYGLSFPTVLVGGLVNSILQREPKNS